MHVVLAYGVVHNAAAMENEHGCGEWPEIIWQRKFTSALAAGFESTDAWGGRKEDQIKDAWGGGNTSEGNSVCLYRRGNGTTYIY